MSLLHGVILFPFVYTLLIPIFYRYRLHVHTGWFVLPVPIVSFIYLLTQLPEVQSGTLPYASLPWIPSLDIYFTIYLDGLSFLFALLITGMGSLVVLYSIYYLSDKKERWHHFYIYLLLFMGAMLGVVLSDHVIILYGFWELTSISSFLLIAYWYNRERSLYAAQKSMLITIFGGLAMLAGLLMLSLMTGTFSIREMIGGFDQLSEQAWFVPAMMLILLGAFTKSAQFPFHIWLPDAMEAPTPVSAYLHSATMVKAGIYLIAKFTPIFAGGAEWFWMVTGFGLVTLFWGSFNAVKQTDLKALLAYSTISQLGLIIFLLGLGSAALHQGHDQMSAQIYVVATTAAIFHLINHATFKGALFMVAGIVDHETGIRDIRKLGGLAALMPVTFTFALMGTFSMAGLPPFNGFLSKEMFFTGVLNGSQMNLFQMESWGWLILAAAWVASVFTFVYSMIFLFTTFTGKFDSKQMLKQPHEAKFGMLLPPAILASLTLVIGLFPNIVSYPLIEPALASIFPNLLDTGERFFVKISFWHGWNTELFMTIGVVIIGVALFITRKRWQSKFQLFPEKYSFNRLYDITLVGLEKVSSRLTNFYMTGDLRHYLIYIFIFLILIVGGLTLFTSSWDFSQMSVAPIMFYEVLLVIVLIMAAVAIPFAKSRLQMIILVGAVGYMVALFFVLFRAPDLALTQMIVETVSVALFLLCFYHLPKLKQEKMRIPFQLVNALIAIGVGAVVTLVALSASGTRLFPPISDYFLRESYDSAGGNNVVNVILVDFRGFDTLLEIMVLGIAALGIYSLINLNKIRKNKEGPHESQ